MVGTYGTLAKVHEILALPLTDTTIDTEINDQILSAAAWVENYVGFYQVAVPVPSSAAGFQTLTDAAAYYTAYLIRRTRDFAGLETSHFKTIAFELIDQWIRGTQTQLGSVGGGRPKEL
jgi:hypothetical protein